MTIDIHVPGTPEFFIYHMIDRKASKLDEDRSKPKEGSWFGEKVYYQIKGKPIEACPWKFYFARKKDFPQWRLKLGWELVKEDDNFIPDGLPPTGGVFELKDLVLAKLPMRRYIEYLIEKDSINKTIVKSARKAVLNVAANDRDPMAGEAALRRSEEDQVASRLGMTRD
jgi:hypothetical protein